MVAYLQAQAVACRQGLAVEHLPVRVVGFPPDQVAGCPPDQVADYQRVPVGGCPPVRVAVSPLDLVAVFLQGLAVVSQLGQEVECPLAQRRI